MERPLLGPRVIITHGATFPSSYFSINVLLETYCMVLFTLKMKSKGTLCKCTQLSHFIPRVLPAIAGGLQWSVGLLPGEFTTN